MSKLFCDICSKDVLVYQVNLLRYFYVMFYLIFLCMISALGGTLLIHKWKEMDREIWSVLKATDYVRWDRMLDTIESYTMQLNNLTSELPASVRDLWPELNCIIRNGRPRFITVPMFGPVLKREFNMTDTQIYRLWVGRNQADQAYDRFIQRMTWMKQNNVLDFLKVTEKPELAQQNTDCV
uniref:Uncharacterized protein n=1 Tax=Graphocephala atropunctata TaxID=36148 RepID=A0A1B6MRE0_9HEMI